MSLGPWHQLPNVCGQSVIWAKVRFSRYFEFRVVGNKSTLAGLINETAFKFIVATWFPGNIRVKNPPNLVTFRCVLGLWQYGLLSFQTRGTKSKSFLPKNQHTQRKLLNFENWISGGLRSFQKSEFQKSIIPILPSTWLMNDEILVLFQCEKWFVYSKPLS